MATGLISRIALGNLWQWRIGTSICTNLSANFSTTRICQAHEESDDGLPKDYKLKVIKPGSRRLDTFVNRTSGKSSSQVEKLIMTGKVRVNEVSVTQRSYNVQRGDVIDIWNQEYPENKAIAEVDRAEIVDYEITLNGYDMKIKLWRKFLVENWRGGGN